MPKPKEIDKEILKKVYRGRSANAHKGDFGKVLVIGGSEKYTGTPGLNGKAALNAMAGYRSGADLITIASVQEAVDVSSQFLPNLITLPLKGKKLTKSHLNTLLAESENNDAFIIGGGLGKDRQTMELVRKFLKRVNIKGVVDADAIKALEGMDMDLSNFILTPHSHEFAILTGQKPGHSLYTRSLVVQKEAQAFGATILLKGHQDIISNGEETLINKTGNPYMTVGGTGDVLAGVIGSLIAQGNSLVDSASAGSYINGKAAENTGRKRSLVATDLMEEIAKIVDSV